jgi:hypothetical protein
MNNHSQDQNAFEFNFSKVEKKSSIKITLAAQLIYNIQISSRQYSKTHKNFELTILYLKSKILLYFIFNYITFCNKYYQN